MTSLYKTETRHRSDGKTCWHFTYHGLTCDQYDNLRARANGCCEICGTPEDETRARRLSIDHFHGHNGVGSFIRGLLCHYCNNVVMCCFDGRKVWSAASRKWEAKAREYEANSWEKPSAEALALMSARKEMPPKNKPRKASPRQRVTAITIPARRGVPAMAAALRKWLTPGEIAQLAALLSEEPPDAV